MNKPFTLVLGVTALPCSVLETFLTFSSVTRSMTAHSNVLFCPRNQRNYVASDFF